MYYKNIIKKFLYNYINMNNNDKLISFKTEIVADTGDII